MKGKVNRAEAHQSEVGLITLYHSNIGMATAQFHFDTPLLAAGSFIIFLFSLFSSRILIYTSVAGKRAYVQSFKPVPCPG